MTLLHIKQLRPGMVLDKDVETIKTGISLLNSGAVLNKKNITLIEKNKIEYINILEKADDTDRFVIIEDKEFKRKHEKLTKETELILNNVRLGKKVILTEISETVDDLIDELTENNNILGRLRGLKDADEYTFGHSLNVCMLSTMVGKWLNYSDVELKRLSFAGLFHDIGKQKISLDIINKPSNLTDKEFEIIKKHTIYGYNILTDTVGLNKNVSLGALQHHEREDGSGYPFGLKSNKIHEFAKIIAVCDVFDAMTSKRVYKDKESPFIVAELLNKNSFGMLDPRITFEFLNNISKFYIGNVVKLNNGMVGEIIYMYNNTPTRPIVKVKNEFIDLFKKRELQIIDVIS